MPQGPPDPRQLGRYFALAQVGLELVAPVVVGAVLDHYLDWQPWGLIVGTVLGLITGIYHLVTISNQQNRRHQETPRQEPP